MSIMLCGHCNKDVSEDNFQIHEVNCKKNNVKCEKCNEIIPKSSYEEHFESLHKLKKCLNCELEFEANRLASHNCADPDQTCKYCEAVMKSSLFDEHLEGCENQTQECEKCKKFIRKKDLENHKKINCVLAQLNVPLPPVPPVQPGFPMPVRLPIPPGAPIQPGLPMPARLPMPPGLPASLPNSSVFNPNPNPFAFNPNPNPIASNPIPNPIAFNPGFNLNPFEFNQNPLGFNQILSSLYQNPNSSNNLEGNQKLLSSLNFNPPMIQPVPQNNPVNIIEEKIDDHLWDNLKNYKDDGGVNYKTSLTILKGPIFSVFYRPKIIPKYRVLISTPQDYSDYNKLNK